MYKIEKGTNDIIINGWEQGIAPSPYEGLADMKNANIISVPGEVSVQFATIPISQPTGVAGHGGNVISANAGADTVTISLTTGSAFDSGSALIFAGAGLAGSGIVAGTVYWAIFVSTAVYQLYTDYALTSLLNITGNATGTWGTIDVATGKYFVYDNILDVTFMVDSAGQVWSNARVTTTNSYWTFTGNKPNNYSNGQGLVYYRSSNGKQYLFVFSNSSIDYTEIVQTGIVISLSWVYQWAPATGTVGIWSATPAQVLKAAAGVALNDSHEALLAPDNRVYYCDTNYIGRWYQTDSAVPFIPTTLATYTFDNTPLLPFNDAALCLSFLGTNLMVGGSKNVIYPWDRFSTNFNYPILVAEFFIKKMITVNTNTFIFAGDRGRIYVTNGSQAQLYKKVPDDISGTVEPHFFWGGVCANRNQLYFSFFVTGNDNQNTPASMLQYGGIWGIDLDTKAIRLVNKLNHNAPGPYWGYASALTTVNPLSSSGTNLFAAWNSQAATTGIDTSSSVPYTNGETTIDSDLIPIGTFLKPTTNGRVEFKLIVPLVSGESIKLQYRQAFSDSFTDISTTTLFNTAGVYSGVYQNVPFQNSQWLQIRAVLTSTATNPSFVRLKEIRIGQ